MTTKILKKDWRKYAAMVKQFIKAKPYTTMVHIRLSLKVIPDQFFHDNVICVDCGHVEEKSTYCIAQNAMGHMVVYTCDCGKQIKLR